VEVDPIMTEPAPQPEGSETVAGRLRRAMLLQQIADEFASLESALQRSDQDLLRMLEKWQSRAWNAQAERDEARSALAAISAAPEVETHRAPHDDDVYPWFPTPDCYCTKCRQAREIASLRSVMWPA
jgi:hypothetical protein